MISFTTATSTMIITVSDSPEGKLGEAQFAFFLDFYYFGFDSYCGYHKICASLQCTERHLLLHPLLLYFQCILELWREFPGAAILALSLRNDGCERRPYRFSSSHNFLRHHFISHILICQYTNNVVSWSHILKCWRFSGGCYSQKVG